jgi:hypothetical protein
MDACQQSKVMRVAAHKNDLIFLCAYYSPSNSRTTEVKNAL